MSKRVPGAIHPGEILLSEFLEPLGITAYRLAKDLHVSLPRVNDIVKGKRGITADTAVRLGRYFNMSSQFWMNLQTIYDLRIADASPDVKKVKAREAA
jgi:addiction module HigA family antidote